MNKSKVLYSIIGFLALMNIGLMFFVLTNNYRPGPSTQNRPEGPKKIIIEKLHFSKEQADAYLELIKKHRSDIETAEENLNQSKKNLYKGLANGEAANETFLNEIAESQAKIEILHYQHFLDIRKLCTEEQLKYFSSLSKELNKIFKHRQMLNKPPR